LSDSHDRRSSNRFEISSDLGFGDCKRFDGGHRDDLWRRTFGGRWGRRRLFGGRDGRRFFGGCLGGNEAKENEKEEVDKSHIDGLDKLFRRGKSNYRFCGEDNVRTGSVFMLEIAPDI